MSRITEFIEVQTSPDRLFHRAVDDWENGSRALRDDAWGPRGSSSRMRNGFRVHRSGKSLGLPEDLELEIRDFVDGAGWVAASASGPDFDWRWTFSPRDGPICRLICTVEYRPVGPGARLLEGLVGRRRRARTIRKLLQSLKMRAEREEALTRARRRRQAGESDSGRART